MYQCFQFPSISVLDIPTPTLATDILPPLLSFGSTNILNPVNQSRASQELLVTSPPQLSNNTTTGN